MKSLSSLSWFHQGNCVILSLERILVPVSFTLKRFTTWSLLEIYSIVILDYWATSYKPSLVQHTNCLVLSSAPLSSLPIHCCFTRFDPRFSLISLLFGNLSCISPFLYFHCSNFLFYLVIPQNLGVIVFLAFHIIKKPVYHIYIWYISLIWWDSAINKYLTFLNMINNMYKDENFQQLI